MRRIIAILLSIIITLTLSACNETQKDEFSSDINNTNSSDSSIGSDVSGEAVTSSDNAPKKNNTSKNNTSTNKPSNTTATNTTSTDNSSVDYKNLKCREIPYYSFEQVQIENTESKIKLLLELPDDWKITKTNKNTMNISRAGKKIGFITSSLLPEYAENYDAICYIINGTEGMTHVVRQIEKQKDVFYRNFSFTTVLNGKTYATNLQVNYTELDDDFANSIVENFDVTLPTKEVPEVSKTNGSKQVLILGNSFINTSEIGSFLNDMFKTANNKYTAIAVSRGMAHAEDYANDTVICNSIRNGEFSYLFICGFYVYESIPALYTLKEACKASNTQLVIFPAHNENASIVKRAIDEHSDTAVLSWKNEIDALINNGVSYFDFCINDAHLHSTPLAGYVGAHMIYRSIFKKTPPTLSNRVSLTNEYINSKLGYYVTSGGSTTAENLIKYQIS